MYIIGDKHLYFTTNIEFLSKFFIDSVYNPRNIYIYARLFIGIYRLSYL